MKRRRISIVWKVTLWYTIFFGMLTAAVAVIAYSAGDYILEKGIRRELMDDVQDVLKNIEFDDGELEIDDDLDFLNRGTYLSIYQNGELVQGFLPKEFDETAPFDYDTVRVIQIAGSNWYIYEQAREFGGYGSIAARGLVSINSMERLHVIFRWMVLLFLPTLLIIAILGGYSLTKRALRPVFEMRQTVEQINGGDDLTKRVNLGEGNDELHKLAHTFNQMFERLEQSFEREKQFSSDVSHELRTPVSVILSQCEYALEQPNGIETKEALTSIYQQTKRMSKMIHQLLILAREEYEIDESKFEEINLSEIVLIVVQEAYERAAAKGIVLETSIEDELFVYGDETLLIRFFMNLVQNAIQYSYENAKVHIELKKQEKKIQGFVKDYGIGIAKEDQEKIWKRLYRGDTARTFGEDSNTGLGLSMVAWVAKVHGGKVEVESEPGEGSVFYFEFPELNKNI